MTTRRRVSFDAAPGGLRVAAVPGYIVFVVDVPDEGDAYEMLFPVERVEELVEELRRAADRARKRRALGVVE